MVKYLKDPLFSFGASGGEFTDSQLPDGSAGYKIVSKDETRVIFKGKTGEITGIKLDKDKILVVPVYFAESHSFFFSMNFYKDYKLPSEVHANISMGVLPGFQVNITYELKNLDLSVLMLPRTPGRLKNVSMGTPVDPETVDTFEFVILKSPAEYTIYLGIPYITDTMPENVPPDKPQVDNIGQWTQKDWKGKTKNEEEMIKHYKQWYNQALTEKKLPGYIDSCGFFTTIIHNGRHYLLDPEGKLFFSVGVDCIRPDSPGHISSAKGLFEELMPKEGKFSPAWSKRGGLFASDEYDFCTANLIKAFGDDWYEAWSKITAYRLKNWGFNTVANWSDMKFARTMGIPYVIMTPFPETDTFIFRDFPDVFSPQYTVNAEKCAEYLNEFKDDRNVIGYFMRNEPMFAFGDYNIALFMLQSENDFHSKQEFISDMKKKYSDDIKAFNCDWETEFSAFEELLKPFFNKLTPESEICLKDFNKKLFRKYIKVPALACRKIDKNHLNLGLRWAWIASENFYEGAEFIDVFSINCYDLAPSREYISEISKMSGGKPVMIGEFHAGALDAGLPSCGLRGVASQSERGYFYSYYVETCADIPELVGAHYFQYNDQPAMGRFDGENGNIGLVDVCGKPHEDMIEKIIETHEKLYDIRSGKIPPSQRRPVTIPKVGL